MPYVNYHPVYLDLNGRRVLIVGGGKVAIEKLESLLPLSGAAITVVSPEVVSEIREWAQEGRLTWIPREFKVEDVDDYFMVIAATDDPELNRLVYVTGNAQNKLANSVDDPINCNFIMAALVRRGPMQVAVSSAGASPALAQRVRNRVASEILTEELGVLAEFLGDHRAVLKERLTTNYKARQRFWETLIESSSVGERLLAGDYEGAEREFETLLEERPYRTRQGKVTLIGAGPGDPELITLKAIRALQKADVVLYDRLVNPEILSHAPAKAKKAYVGKEVGHPGKGRQRSINDAMIKIARAGRNVVRLKGGDPYVFGRGGEEAIALREAGLEFEVIPGISSSIAGPGAIGIPVTHRAVATNFAVFAGHEAEGRDRLPWEAAAQVHTAVFLMGVERLPIIVDQLIAHGRNPETPVAVISEATRETQRSVIGTLSTIVDLASDLPAPAVIVVGDVVSLASRIKPSENNLCPTS